MYISITPQKLTANFLESAADFIIESYQKQMVSLLDSIERFENRFYNIINQSKIYPTWAIIVSVLFGTDSITYETGATSFNYSIQLLF
jgi:hypothetical protein